jgi:hypothetical protein
LEQSAADELIQPWPLHALTPEHMIVLPAAATGVTVANPLIVSANAAAAIAAPDLETCFILDFLVVERLGSSHHGYGHLVPSPTIHLQVTRK